MFRCHLISGCTLEYSLVPVNVASISVHLRLGSSAHCLIIRSVNGRCGLKVRGRLCPRF